ncbi:regulatory protein IclR [Actinobacteria bacterium OK074]|nr:regulatory protein IclR [Actinobacteria bacterium OK074]
MSDVTTDAPRTLHAVPTPEPLAHLTGAPTAVYTALTNLTDGDEVTAAELALASGLGRSTTGKALTTLEEHGLAVRTHGGHDGARRTPDLWRAAPTAEPDSSNADQTLAEATSAEPELPSTTQEPDLIDTDSEDAPTTEPTPDESGEPEPDNAPDGETTQEVPLQTPETTDTDAHTETDPTPEDSNIVPEAANDSAPQPPQDQQTEVTVTEATVIPLTDNKRLAPGALRQMVIDHLKAHPDEAFTATRISRAIDKSSGAIANALEKLAKQEVAEQVSDRPRTYRLATTEANLQ